jgi:hypothetical protein
MTILLLSMLWASSAHALQVERGRHGDYVVVSAELPHSIEAVNSILSEDVKTMKLGQAVRKVTATPLPNGCTELEVVNEGFAKDLSYVAERCPTKNGWHSKMISSDDFDEHEIIWETDPFGPHSKVTIQVKVSLKYPVPNFLVRRIVGGALEETLEKLHAALEAEKQNQ